MNNKYNDIRFKFLHILGETVVNSLKKRGFLATYVNQKEEALRLICDLIQDGSSVGIPGSVTIREIGAIAALKEKGCTIYEHWNMPLTIEEKNKIFIRENSADYFLTSSNAVTRNGILVNVDGVGNRISGMSWGIGELIYVISMNKVADNLEAAFSLIRNRSCVLSALRRGVDSPCAQVGYCVNCMTSQKVCKAFLIQEAPPTGRKANVILVGQTLGC
ncbi:MULTISPECIES: lactate utilization protein [Aminobacterium]|jgi:hypothetical protein|uniref:LUD domain-containing protein n=1 Tax=Aminobacterium colombiense (strain DSM 12261 / ALA-1) TaxID=572547 RepID=D5EDL0_AMICL|nr:MULTISPECIES: lactate utilization protein [Aminobacterium]ADE56642.1 protein of unknown function DUF1121 [Aminobacterium colombiense DSM 12261]NLK30054.1 LUD domain-containing protein [Aminobacterium colombiense]